MFLRANKSVVSNQSALQLTKKFQISGTMSLAIVWFSVLAILSNFVLENVQGQSTQKDSSTVFEALQNLTKAVESLQVLLGKVEAKVEIQGNALKELVGKEKWPEPIPQFSTNRTIVALEGDDVEIWCNVHGNPTPEIKWTRENGDLRDAQVVVKNNANFLRIKNARFIDEGTYVCVATNGVGTPISQSARLEVYGPAKQCLRMVESDTGHLEEIPSTTSCLWVIKLQNTTGFRLELDPRMTKPISVISEPNSAHSNVHSIQFDGSKNASYDFEGKILAIVVPPRREGRVLSWTGLAFDGSGNSSSTKFVQGVKGTLEWESRGDGLDNVFWAFDYESTEQLNWTLNTNFGTRDQEDSCETVSFSILQIRSDGNISEVQKRTCDGSTEGSLKFEINSQVLLLMRFQSLEASRSKLRVSWTHQDEPMEKNVDGIVAGTERDGVYVIPLDSARRQWVPLKWVDGLTFDWNSRRIYYLNSGVGIMRSNLNGTESEMLSSDKSFIRGITIEPTTGNFYYGDRSNCTIRVCNNDATKCSTIANSSSDYNAREFDLAVHQSKGFLFWSTSSQIVRANLDGSNATVILQRYGVRGIDVDEQEDRLYWGSNGERIGSCDLNGQHIRELPIISRYITDVAIDNDKVYYNAVDMNTCIYVTSKLGRNEGSFTHSLSTSINFKYIALFGTRVSNKPPNPCDEAKCAHLCVLVTRWSYRCTCPDTQVLNADGKTCNI